MQGRRLDGAPRSEEADTSLLIVGNDGGSNVGSSLLRAANKIGLSAKLHNAQTASRGPRLVRAFAWRLLGHRPPRLRSFGRRVAASARGAPPRWLLATGLAPLDATTLAGLGELGVERSVYLTDDPWNPSFRSRWFFVALRHYDHVFTTRRANVRDLQAHGCADVCYLPFGFDPELFFRQEAADAGERNRLASDVLFIGGGDRDRVPYLGAISTSGVRLAVYGDYWDRFRATRSNYRGYADLETARKATHATRVALCLARRSNRDGHVMRSFEIPAIGACMLAEDTAEHRELFGVDGEAVVYFSSIDGMLERLRWLLAHDAERRRLAAAAQRVVTQGKHTYQDRLATMLRLAGGEPRS